MIDVRELRIGNLIIYGNQNIYYKVKSNSFEPIEFVPSLYKPIPLTPEVLSNAGFDLDYEYMGETKYKNGEVEILQTSEQRILGGFRLLNGEECFAWSKVYFYLHEIQNMCYALTGQELQFNNQ